MNIFNRVILVQEPDPEAAAKVWAALRKAGIPYTVKTKGRSGTSPMVRFGTGQRTGSMAGGSAVSATYRSGGMPHSWMDSPQGNTFYAIHVKKEDLERAKKVCGMG